MKNNLIKHTGIFILGCLLSWLFISILYISPRDQDIGNLQAQVETLENQKKILTKNKKNHESEKQKILQENKQLKLSGLIRKEMNLAQGRRNKLQEIIIKGGFISEDTNEFVQIEKKYLIEIEMEQKQLQERIVELEKKLSAMKK